MNRIPTVLNWSSGKDAALAYHILQNSDYEVKTLLTTINDEHDRERSEKKQRHTMNELHAPYSSASAASST